MTLSSVPLLMVCSMPLPLDEARLLGRYRKLTLDAEAEKKVAKAVREAKDDPDNRPLHETRVDNAEGVPVQIIVGGKATVSMQRYRWKPDRIADSD